jgi:hypothetical protein
VIGIELSREKREQTKAVFLCEWSAVFTWLEGFDVFHVSSLFFSVCGYGQLPMSISQRGDTLTKHLSQPLPAVCGIVG